MGNHTLLVAQASVCNRARFEGASSDDAGQEPKILGDATDSGLLRYVDRLTNYQLLREKVHTRSQARVTTI